MWTWLQTILQSLAALTISPTTPLPDGDWKLIHGWQTDGPRLVLTAESLSVVEYCKQNPADHLVTPILIQGGHEIWLDGDLIHSTVDREFRQSGNFYNAARVPCSLLTNGRTVRWQAFTQTHALAKLERFPDFTDHALGPFLRQTANVFSAGTLLGLGMLCLLMFYGKVEGKIIAALLGCCLCYGFMFALYVPNAFLINLPQSTLQRLLDSSLWLGFICLARFFYLLEYTSKRLQSIVMASCVVGIFFIWTGATLDQSQVAQNLPFAMSYIFLFNTLRNTRFLGHSNRFARRNDILKFLAILCFVITGLNDVLLFQVGLDSEPTFPFGILGCVAFLALAVNDRVVEAYEERDFLRINLEKEVERKTEDLRLKSAELSNALDTLKSTQADLVQSAKLASLGTLSAGIAHEINNALNYVNGSIEPLNRILKKDQIGDMDRSKAGRLLALMKEGLDLTFGIIVNLKRQTSTSGAVIETLPLKETVDGVLLLLKNRLSEIEVLVNIDPSLKFEASQVGISQVLMNLLNNAADAILDPKNSAGRPKKIVISGEPTSQGVTLRIADSGPGIPSEIRERIFDPFFTTKDIGKGTGLGLHIVSSEMKKHGGRVEIETPAEGGAQFVLFFPSKTRNAESKEAGAA